MRTHEQALQLQAKLELVEDSKQTAAVQGDLNRTLEHLQTFVAESLTEIGCEIKDYKSGLIRLRRQTPGPRKFIYAGDWVKTKSISGTR